MSGLHDESNKDKLLDACHLLSAVTIDEISLSSNLADLYTDQSYSLYFGKIFEKRDLLVDGQEKIVKVLVAFINIFKNAPQFDLENTKQQWIQAAILQDKYFSDLSPTSATTKFFSGAACDAFGLPSPQMKAAQESQEAKSVTSPKVRTAGKIETFSVKVWEQAESEINKILEKTAAGPVVPLETSFSASVSSVRLPTNAS